MVSLLIVAVSFWLSFAIGKTCAFCELRTVARQLPYPIFGQRISTRTCNNKIRSPLRTVKPGNEYRRRDLSRLVSLLQVNDDHPQQPNVIFRIQSEIKGLFSVASLNNEVFRWRAAAAAAISSIVLFQPFLDRQMAKLWSFLLKSPSWIATAFRHDHWEWMLAVVAFSVYIHLYWLADRAVLHAGKQGKIHPWKKYRLQDRWEESVHNQHNPRDNNHQPQQQQPPLVTTHSPWNWQGWIFELWVYVVPLFFLDRRFPRRAVKLSRFVKTPPTTMLICRDVTCSLLLYDFFFFCGHVLMHRLPFLWTIHKKHHDVKEVRAGDVVRLSLIEEVVEVLMSIIALTLLKAHPVSRTIYNCIITFLLTELHCGFDFPWSPQNVVPFGFATGSRRHHYHHRHGTHYYQKFFHSLDRMFGFYQANDGSIRGDSVQPVKKIVSRSAGS